LWISDGEMHRKVDSRSDKVLLLAS
jgi:hypothetical protein